jgi:hypothetical protein
VCPIYLSVHWSEHFALQNVACKQAIGFIFPIHWSELSTSLKATLRVSDLSFGSLSEHFALQNVTCLASHRIYLSDSLSEQINCVNLWLVNKPSDLSFRFIKIKKNRPQKLI